MVASLSLEASKAVAKGHIDIVPDSFSFLKGLFKNFDRIQWKTLRFYYKPAVGTTYGGMVAVGMDWDFASSDVERKLISAFTPNFATAAWTDTQNRPMSLPANRLQSRTWYTPSASGNNWPDKGPGKLHWAIEGTAEAGGKLLGELWAEYSVVMMGTNPA